jgi:hypothetical protein
MNKTDLYNEILNSLKSDKIYKIAFIGDSLTSCEWIHPNWREVFEYILKFSFDEFEGDDWWIPEWNLRFYNYALDGASTKNFLEMTSTAMKEVDPDLFIIMGTANDIELGISVDQHKKNLTKLFSQVNKKLIYSPSVYSQDKKKNEKYIAYVEVAMNIPVTDNIYRFNGYEKFRDCSSPDLYTLNLKENTNEKDPTHPNSLGNIYIAKMFLEELLDIKVDPEKYLKDLRSDTVKFPKW